MTYNTNSVIVDFTNMDCRSVNNELANTFTTRLYTSVKTLKSKECLMAKVLLTKNDSVFSLSMLSADTININSYKQIFPNVFDIKSVNYSDIPSVPDKGILNTYILMSLINSNLDPSEADAGFKDLISTLKALESEIVILIRYRKRLKDFDVKFALRFNGTPDKELVKKLSVFFPDVKVYKQNCFVENILNGDKDLTRVKQSVSFKNMLAFTPRLFSMLLEEYSVDEIIDPAEDSPIEELGLSLHTYNALKRSGINYVYDLLFMSDDELLRIRNLGRKGCDEVLAAIEIYKDQCIEDLSRPRIDYYEKLESLIGLDSVKNQVKSIAAYTRMLKCMNQNKILTDSTESISLNMEFRGNPGTAKTTVARIMAGILYDTGFVRSPEIVEVGRSGIVGRYVGETAIKVKELFKKSHGKVLFIDEAYSLVDDYDKGYGDEAISTIVQEMENNRHDTVVIFAGYPDKMDDFFKTNPGLKSRVPFHITFEDYSPSQMLEITRLEAEKRGFKIATDAEDKIKDICRKATLNPDSGNGRFCRNLAESALLRFASRNFGGKSSKSFDKKSDFELAQDDFVLPEELTSVKKQMRIGFAAV